MFEGNDGSYIIDVYLVIQGCSKISSSVILNRGLLTNILEISSFAGLDISFQSGYLNLQDPTLILYKTSLFECARKGG